MMQWDDYKKFGANERTPRPGPGGWWYHHAPTTERDRIQQHGLIPSPPNQSEYDWGVENQPEGVYLTNGPEALKRTLFGHPGAPQQLDTWRVPAEGLEVHPDPIIWENAAYTPHPIPSPELFRPYEKSNEFQRAYPHEDEQFHSGPVPEDWVHYQDYHELGLPSDEEWNSYGIGQDPEMWKKAADLYHVAPTVERERINTWGLQPADPYHDNGLSPEGWAEAYGPDYRPPSGVYGWDNMDAAKAWRDQSEHADEMDIWRFEGNPLQDPDTERGRYVPHPVQPELAWGPENWATASKTASMNHYWHVAPQAVREDIERDGVKPFSPADNPAWDGYGVIDNRGTYLWSTLPAAQKYRDRINDVRQAPHDIWADRDASFLGGRRPRKRL